MDCIDEDTEKYKSTEFNFKDDVFFSFDKNKKVKKVKKIVLIVILLLGSYYFLVMKILIKKLLKNKILFLILSDFVYEFGEKEELDVDEFENMFGFKYIEFFGTLFLFAIYPNLFKIKLIVFLRKKWIKLTIYILN